MRDFIKDVLIRMPYAFQIAKSVLNKYRYFKLKDQPAQEIFTRIYHQNAWGDPDSVSGPGSNLQETAVLRTQLPELFRRFNISSILDIPCGDFHWMKEVDIEGVCYLGADIVPQIVESNKQYENANIQFMLLDIIENSLPKVDLLFVRDCLVHFSNEHIFKALFNICRSDSQYLITTTFVDRSKNVDIATGQWRPLNLQIAPFHLPEPIMLINEQHPNENYSDKSLGLWKISDIRNLIEGTVKHC